MLTGRSSHVTLPMCLIFKTFFFLLPENNRLLMWGSGCSVLNVSACYKVFSDLSGSLSFPFSLPLFLPPSFLFCDRAVTVSHWEIWDPKKLKVIKRRVACWTHHRQSPFIILWTRVKWEIYMAVKGKAGSTRNNTIDHRNRMSLEIRLIEIKWHIKICSGLKEAI